HGYVYGSVTDAEGPKKDPSVHQAVYDGRKGRGTWPGFVESDPERSTTPGGIFAKRTEGNTDQSRGYLDDECDGIVEIRLDRLSAIARVGAGPPAYAPDSFPIRSVMD